MGMYPEEYLRSFVEGNYEDCVDDPSCVRRAFNAAVSAYHFADHYYRYHEKNNPEAIKRFASYKAFLDEAVEKTGGALHDIRCIANAYKHLYVTRGEYSVDSAGRIESIELAESESDSISRIGWDFDSAEAFRVVYTRVDGTRGDFLGQLKIVVDYWYKLQWPGAADV